MKKGYSVLYGIALCFLLALPAWFLGKQFPIIGGPVFAILIGIGLTTSFPQLITRPLFKNHSHGDIYFEQGIKYTSKKLLQYAIILLGFEMNLFNIITVGEQSLLVMLFTLSGSFLTAYFVGKALNLPGDVTTLIGVGTSICGGSAIAATAPVIGANEEDVARSISTIFLFNIVAVLLFPILGHAMHMTDMDFGMWAGTAINDTSSVVAAGTAWSQAAGNTTALNFATIVKLTRTLMIVPITLVLALYTARKKEHTNGDDFNFAKVFPWFVIFFILAAIANTFLGIPPEISKALVTLGQFMIVMAMMAIGLNTNVKKLLSNGFKPILLGVCCWVVVSVVSLIVQYLILS